MKRLFSFLLIGILLISCSTSLIHAEGIPTISVESVTVQPGNIAEVAIRIDNNPGITSLQISVAYPGDDLELLSIQDMRLFGNSISSGPLTKNPIKISWYDGLSNRTENGELVVLRFQVAENVSSAQVSISYNPNNIFTNTFDNVFFNTEDGIITVKEKDPVLLGDVNGDGKVNIKDCTAIQRYLADLGTIDEVLLEAADTDGNGFIEINDASVLQEYLSEFFSELGSN